MRVLSWLTSCVLLCVLIGGVGLVVAFALDQTSLLNCTVGAALVVTAWHGLRRLGPDVGEGDPADHWPTAVLVVGAFAVMEFLVLWNPWFATGWVIFPLWLKLRGRS